MRSFFTALFLLVATVAVADPTPYRLNPGESRVGFTWFFGADAVNGRMPVADADLILDFDRVSNSRVNVSLDLVNVQAGFPFASQALKAQNMLWAARFPTIDFESTRVTQNGSGARIEGNLTMRGVTRPVTLAASIFRKQGAPAGERDELAIRMTGAVSRAAFGAEGWPNEVGDEVQLDILALVERER